MGSTVPPPVPKRRSLPMFLFHHKGCMAAQHFFIQMYPLHSPNPSSLTASARGTWAAGSQGAWCAAPCTRTWRPGACPAPHSATPHSVAIFPIPIVCGGSGIFLQKRFSGQRPPLCTEHCLTHGGGLRVTAPTPIDLRPKCTHTAVPDAGDLHTANQNARNCSAR